MVIAGGERIEGGPFDGFKLVAQSEFGVISATVNVYTADDRFVGYIPDVALEDFRAGDSIALRPVENWRHTFSKALMEKLGLSVGERQPADEQSNQEVIVASLLVDADILDSYLRSKIDDMGTLELFDLAENGLNMGFDIDAQDDGETVWVTAWSGREEGFEMLKEYLGSLPTEQKPSGPRI